MSVYGEVATGPQTGMVVMLIHGRVGIVLRAGKAPATTGEIVLLSASGVYFRRRRGPGPVARA